MVQRHFLVLSRDEAFEDHIRDALENAHTHIHSRAYIDLDDAALRPPTLGAFIDLDSVDEESAAAVAAALPSATAAHPDRTTTIGSFVQGYQSLPLVKDDEGHWIKLVHGVARHFAHTSERQTTQRDIVRTTALRYQRLLEALPDIVYKVDPEGCFTYVNRAVKHLGYEPEDLLGKHFSVLLYPGEAERVGRESVLGRIRETGAIPKSPPQLFDERRSGERLTRDLNVRLRRRNPGPDGGLTMHADVLAYGEVAATGNYTHTEEALQFTGTVGIIRDVTERFQVQRNLTRLSEVVERSNMGVVVVDTAGVVDYANSRFFAIVNAGPHEVMGRRIDHIAWGERLRWEAVAESLRSTGKFSTDLQLQEGSTSESLRWFEISAYPINLGEFGADQVVVFHSDIQERKRRERELAQALLRQEAYLREVHHRVKNNLQVIASLLALENQHDAGESRVSELLDRNMGRLRIIAAAHELLEHADDLARVDLNTYVNDVIAGVHGGSGHGLQIAQDIDSIRLPLDAIVPLGIMLHEVMTQTLRFHITRNAEEEATVCVTGRTQGDTYSLTIHGSENLQIHTAVADGQELLAALTQQIGAKVEALENGYHLEFSVAAVERSELARLNPTFGCD
ncbi:MAG: PAS domain S-box protein [Spirochaetaceae bacterium]